MFRTYRRCGTRGGSSPHGTGTALLASSYAIRVRMYLSDLRSVEGRGGGGRSGEEREGGGGGGGGGAAKPRLPGYLTRTVPSNLVVSLHGPNIALTHAWRLPTSVRYGTGLTWKQKFFTVRTPSVRTHGRGDTMSRVGASWLRICRPDLQTGTRSSACCGKASNAGCTYGVLPYRTRMLRCTICTVRYGVQYGGTLRSLSDVALLLELGYFLGQELAWISLTGLVGRVLV